jgi:NAD+ synthase (glutamine-hydrolysing)
MKKERLRIALAQINPVVGDLKGNSDKVIAWMKKAVGLGADIVSFPELITTGYPPEDLLLKSNFIADNIQELERICRNATDIVAVVGFADQAKKGLYNAAAVAARAKVRGVYHKVYLPNYGVFDEKRYFAAGKDFPVFAIGRTAFGVNICEDIWHLEGPAGVQAYKGARLIININASPYHMGKGLMREKILKAQAKKNNVFISYVNLVGGQDELVFDGQSLVIDDKGRVIARAKAFAEELLVIDVDLKECPRKSKIFLGGISPDKTKLAGPSVAAAKEETGEVYHALVLGLKDYIFKNNFKKAVLGLSGGIDSSLVATLAVDAIGAKNIVGVSMPSAYTSQESKEDAQRLARNLGIEFQTVPIQEIVDKYLEFLKAAFAGKAPDVTEENLQARVRGNILMALSNKFGYLALNTGNKSEVSCGYCTLYGDMAGGFGVIKDVPKMLVYKLAEFKNKKEGREVIPARVFEKAPTAELRVNQKDSDSLPEYVVLDKALKLYVEEDMSLTDMVRSGILPDVANTVVRLVDSNEYKRRQAPPGIKITPKAFGKDRRMPITNRYR